MLGGEHRIEQHDIGLYIQVGEGFDAIPLDKLHAGGYVREIGMPGSTFDGIAQQRRDNRIAFEQHDAKARGRQEQRIISQARGGIDGKRQFDALHVGGFHEHFAL